MVIIAAIVVSVGAYMAMSGNGEGEGPPENQPVEEAKKLKLGFAMVSSGAESWWYELHVQGIHVAQSIVNEYEDDHIQIKLDHSDTKLQPDQALAAVKELDTIRGVHGIIGTSSSVIMTAHDYCKRNKIPEITGNAGSKRLDDIGGREDFLWRVYPSDSLGGVAIGAASDKLGYKRIALLVESKPGYLTWAETIRPSLEAIEGIELVKEVEVSGGKPSYSSSVSKLLGANPDVILSMAANETCVSVINEAQGQGYEGDIILPDDAASAEFIELIKDTDTSKIFLEAPSTPKIPEWRMNRYKDHLEKSEGHRDIKYLKSFAVAHYDATMIFALAAEKVVANGGELTRKNIANEMEAVATPPGKKVDKWEDAVELINEGEEIDFQGMMSTCDFDKNGNVTGPYGISEVNTKDWTWNRKLYLGPGTLNEYWKLVFG